MGSQDLKATKVPLESVEQQGCLDNKVPKETEAVQDHLDQMVTEVSREKGADLALMDKKVTLESQVSLGLQVFRDFLEHLVKMVDTSHLKPLSLPGARHDSEVFEGEEVSV